MLNKLSLNLGFYMNKKSKLGLCFIVGIVLISAMAYLLFGAQESGKSLGSLIFLIPIDPEEVIANLSFGKFNLSSSINRSFIFITDFTVLCN